MTKEDFFSLDRQPLEWEEPTPKEYLSLVERDPLMPDAKEDPPSEPYFSNRPTNEHAAYLEAFSRQSIGLDTMFSAEMQKSKTSELSSRKRTTAQPSEADLKNRSTQHGLSKIAQNLANREQFRNIDGRLYQFEGSNWVLRIPENAHVDLFNVVQQHYPDLVDYISTHNYKEIYCQLCSRIDREDMEELSQDNQHYLCCKNGLYSLADGKILPPDPGLDLFYHINLDVNQINQSSNKYTERFLQNVTDGNLELRKLILEMIAAIITALPVKCFFFLEGEGNTGKSQLIKFLEMLLGAEACYSLTSINELSGRWTFGKLIDKLMCSCADIPNCVIKQSSISRIKQIAGDDRVSGELKGIDFFTFDCQAKLVFGSNHPPKVSNTEKESAFFERMIRIPFCNPVPKGDRIPQLYRQLFNEAGYIVQLAMLQREELLSNNLVFTQLSHSPELLSFIKPSDEKLVTTFLDEFCVLDPESKIPTSVLYDAFCKSGLGPDIEISRFGRLVSQYGLHPKRNSEGRFIPGIKLKQMDEQ